ncbi:MAG: sulfatase-like hydrolase/transferase [Myxococcales bacterium]|nr:sulfatase-like hydrolase/transferase [Myxococcales bacterium]
MGCGPGVAAYTPPPPNVLVVLLDDIGLDGVGAYGLSPHPPRTPTIDQLASEGVTFTHAYAYPLCSPTRAALLTGRYGRRFALGSNIPFNGSNYALPLEEVTIAEMARLSASGDYRSGIYGKWHLGSRTIVDVEHHPRLQGFDHAVTNVANLQSALDPKDAPSHDYAHWEEVEDGVPRHVDGYQPTHLVDVALKGIARLGEPWVVYLPMHTAHGPMHVPPASLQTTGVTDESTAPELFRAVVEAGDRELGRLLARLPPRVRKRTVVLVMGDNGTNAPNSAEGWSALGGKGTVADGGIRVPLVIAAPGLAPPGTVHDGLVHAVDLFPTIAELIGVDLAEVHSGGDRTVEIDGHSLVPALRHPEGPGTRQWLYTEHFGPEGATQDWRVDKRVLTDGHYKLVDYPTLGTQVLTQVGPSPEDETANLLLELPLSTDALAAYQALSDEIDGIVPTLAADAATR